MERNGKRRIITTDEDKEENKEEQDYDDEEEKIEKFFAIIRRIREARTSITKCLHELEVSNKDAKKVRVHGPTWTPVFELEDFAGVLEKDDNASLSKRFYMKGDISNGKEEKGLDLNLTL